MDGGRSFFEVALAGPKGAVASGAGLVQWKWMTGQKSHSKGGAKAKPKPKPQAHKEEGGWTDREACGGCFGGE
jgi:hypothetical protein